MITWRGVVLCESTPWVKNTIVSERIYSSGTISHERVNCHLHYVQLHLLIESVLISHSSQRSYYDGYLRGWRKVMHTIWST